MVIHGVPCRQVPAQLNRRTKLFHSPASADHWTKDAASSACGDLDGTTKPVRNVNGVCTAAPTIMQPAMPECGVVDVDHM